MAYKYFPQTNDDISEMLNAIGLSGLEDLYGEVPEELKLNRDYDLPSAMSEVEVRNHFNSLGNKNKQLVCQ